MHVKHVSIVSFYHVSNSCLPNVMKISAKINTMQNTNILTKRCNINAPQGVSHARFSQNSQSYTPFQNALAVKISLDLLKRLWSYEDFKLTGSG